MKKLFFVLMIVSLSLGAVFAQDDWGESWGDESSSNENSAGGFWNKFKLSGDASLAGRVYFDAENAGDAPVSAIPELELGLTYEGDSTNFNAQINLSERTLLNNYMDVLDEFHADVFLGDFVLSAGKMKVVWGKGDKLHVLDNFNANDYTDFLIPDYLDRRAGEYMFRVQYNAPQGFRLEGIYTPVMRGEVYAKNGRWVPAKVGTLTGVAKEVAAQNILLAAGDPPGTLNQASLAALMSASSMSEDDLYPDTNKLEYGQFGVYGNFTVGIVDIGVSYYNGHYKQVTADMSGYIATKIKNAMGGSVPLAMPTLHYDKLQVFGLDAQTAIGPFTVRGEFAYNLTKDTDGDDPWTRNNSISYLAGFDVGIPLHNLNLNVQATGNFVLNKNEIDDDKNPYKTYDTDYDPTGNYSNNKIVVQLKDTFNYEKIEAIVKMIYGFERQDLVLMPELSYKVRDGWKASLSGLFIHNFSDDETDSEFYGWLDNSFIQLKVNYTF